MQPASVSDSPRLVDGWILISADTRLNRQSTKRVKGGPDAPDGRRSAGTGDGPAPGAAEQPSSPNGIG